MEPYNPLAVSPVQAAKMAQQAQAVQPVQQGQPAQQVQPTPQRVAPVPPPRKPIDEEEGKANCPTVYHSMLYNKTRDDRAQKKFTDEQKRKGL